MPPSSTCLPPAIDGTPSPLPGLSIIDLTGVDTTAEIKFDRVMTAFGLGLGAGEGGSVALGLLASRAGLELNSTVWAMHDPSRFATLEESVDMLSGGLVIAGQMDTSISNGVGLSLNGRAGLLYASGELEAAQTANWRRRAA